MCLADMCFLGIFFAQNIFTMFFFALQVIWTLKQVQAAIDFRSGTAIKKS